MKQTLTIVVAILILAVSPTAACCLGPVSAEVSSATPVSPDSEHHHSSGPSAPHEDESVLPCCSTPADGLLVANFSPAFDVTTTAMLPVLDAPSVSIQIRLASSLVHESPPGKHDLLLDTSVLRI